MDPLLSETLRDIEWIETRARERQRCTGEAYGDRRALEEIQAVAYRILNRLLDPPADGVDE